MTDADDNLAVQQLVSKCVAGDAAAVHLFQELYGELIYAFPLRAYRLAPDAAGEFYVWVFEKGRIFRRARTYAGRAPFRAYLLGVVLDHLFIDWRRATRHAEILAMDEVSAQSDTQLQSHADDRGPAEASRIDELLVHVDSGRAVILKLLHIEDFELSADDIRHIAKHSGHSIPQVIAAVEGLRRQVRERESQLQSLADDVEALRAWIGVYERRVEKLERDLAFLAPQSAAALRCVATRAQLEARLQRRRAQKTRLELAKRRRKVTAPYKEIAALLGTSVGNVASQISRVRQELTQAGIGQEGNAYDPQRNGQP